MVCDKGASSMRVALSRSEPTNTSIRPPAAGSMVNVPAAPIEAVAPMAVTSELPLIDRLPVAQTPPVCRGRASNSAIGNNDIATSKQGIEAGSTNG